MTDMKTYYFDRFRNGRQCGLKPGRKPLKSGGYVKAPSLNMAEKRIRELFKDHNDYFKLRTIV